MYKIEVTINDGKRLWRRRAAIRKNRFNGNPYYLFDDLMTALNGFRDLACFIEYATKYFSEQIGKWPFALGKAPGA